MTLITTFVARRIVGNSTTCRTLAASVSYSNNFGHFTATSCTFAIKNNNVAINEYHQIQHSKLSNPMLTHHRSFRTRSFQTTTGRNTKKLEPKPGSKAFAECETAAIQDLFHQYARVDNDGGGIDEDGAYLCLNGIRQLLNSIGEKPDDKTIMRLFKEADQNNDGKLHLDVSVSSNYLLCFSKVPLFF